MKLSSALFYEGFRFFLGPVAELAFRISSEGADNVPESGPGIIVANHRCYLDPLILALSVQRLINFAAGSHLYSFPGAAAVLRLPGFFPMHIYGGTEGDRSLEEASRLLSDGELIGIFPEGIESFMNIDRASLISEFKTGFVRVAIENRVPIIPAAIIGLVEKELVKLPGALVKPFVKHPRASEGVMLVNYTRVRCRIGMPLDLSPYHGEPLTKDLMDRVAARVRQVVVKLYEGNDLERIMTGEAPFNFAQDSL